MGVLYAVLIVLSLVALLWSAGRSRELCVLSVRQGRVLVMRGALPTSLLEAIADIVARQRVARATLRFLRDGERGRLVATGLDAPSAQRVRNVLGTYPLPKLLTAPPPRAPNLGQRLGLSWLAWRLRRRR